MKTMQAVAALGRYFAERANRRAIRSGWVEWSADLAVALKIERAAIDRAARHVRRVPLPDGWRARYSRGLWTVEPSTAKPFTLRKPRSMAAKRRDVHTEHCKPNGCKYGDPDCTVAKGRGL